MDESDDSCCDVLELCDLLEEYKELSEKRFNENALLQQSMQQLKQENIILLSKNEEQSTIIDDLQNSITSLVSDIDSMALVLSSKDKDISNLSNCLYLMHEKKVNIDDTYSLEQEQTISTLLKEINRIESVNSSNEALLEDYMNIINQKDLEITELQALLRLSKTNQSLSPGSEPTVTEIVTAITTDSGHLISPTSSSNSPTDSSSSSSSRMVISPTGGRLANSMSPPLPPPPPPNKAPPVGLTLDYKLKGKDYNRSSDSVDRPMMTRKQYDGQQKKGSSSGRRKVVVQQQSSSNQDDSSNSPANSCSNHERTTTHHDDDDDDDDYHNAEHICSADEDSQTEEEEEEEEEGSPVAVVINRDYSNRMNKNRSFVTAASVAAASAVAVRGSRQGYRTLGRLDNQSSHMIAKASPGDNSSSISSFSSYSRSSSNKSSSMNYDLKTSKKEGRSIASSSLAQHGERQRDIIFSTTTTTSTSNNNINNNINNNKPATTAATAGGVAVVAKWSDARKHENLFTRVPIFKSHHLDSSSSSRSRSHRYNYFPSDVTIEDMDPAEEDERC